LTSSSSVGNDVLIEGSPWRHYLTKVREMDEAMVRQVRSFNRTVTQRIGVLSDAFLARDRPLGQARLLWEIGPGGCDVRQLRSRLDLDSGYLSRLLRALESDGLVVVEPSGTDGRVRSVRLTPAGLAERAVLDERSDAAAAVILSRLDPRQRARLAAAMAETERLLTASAVEVADRDPGHPDARFCLQAYFSEIAGRFDGGFDPVRSPVREEQLTPPAGLFLVATLHDEPVGCGGIKFPAGASAYIKRMWVSPAVRGLGLGRRLLAELEERAAARQMPAVQLETNRALPEAIALYRSAGYREVPAFNDEPYAHHWFEKSVSQSSAAIS
jgi:DNA-binding MarR family transcriptional regulator/N-acetylglutamate synthase-like GNAT family acetyltransferase